MSAIFRQCPLPTQIVTCALPAERPSSGRAADDPIADIAAAEQSEAMTDLNWDERLKKVAMGKPKPENPE